MSETCIFVRFYSVGASGKASIFECYVFGVPAYCRPVVDMIETHIYPFDEKDLSQGKHSK
jgi:hypothetical protein